MAKSIGTLATLATAKALLEVQHQPSHRPQSSKLLGGHCWTHIHACLHKQHIINMLKQLKIEHLSMRTLSAVPAT